MPTSDTMLISSNGRTVTMPKWVAGLVTSLLTAAILGLVTMVFGVWRQSISLEVRVAQIESNRFTSGDALTLLRDLPTMRDYEALWNELEEIKLELRSLRSGQ